MTLKEECEWRREEMIKLQERLADAEGRLVAIRIAATNLNRKYDLCGELIEQKKV